MKAILKPTNFLFVAIIIAVLIVPSFLARITFEACNRPSGISFEEHLLTAKECVAKEIGYEGPLDTEYFQIYEDNGYRYVIKEDGVITDSGIFKSNEAISELEAALAYNDHHPNFVETADDIFGTFIISLLAAASVWLISAGGIILGAYRLIIFSGKLANNAV